MPTYDYYCKECNYVEEIFQSMSADQLTECPSCKRPSFTRRIGAGAGLVFKGSGFYLTDYKSSNGKTSKSELTGETTTSSTESAKPSSGETTVAKSPSSTADKE
jgi:putative FmdB family regulatory protein